MDEGAALDPRHAEDEAEQRPVRREGARGHATEPLRDLEDGGRDGLAKSGAPGGRLQVDAPHELPVRAYVADLHVPYIDAWHALGDERRRRVGAHHTPRSPTAVMDLASRSAALRQLVRTARSAAGASPPAIASMITSCSCVDTMISVVRVV